MKRLGVVLLVLAACARNTPAPVATVDTSGAANSAATVSASNATVQASRATVTVAQSTIAPQAPTPIPPKATGDQVVFFSGAFTYTNEIPFRRFADHSAVMFDLSGFARRDENWEIPTDGQTIGFMKVDRAAKRGSFKLSPPAQPRGQFVDVDNNGRADTGVQVYTIAFSGNRFAGPFAEGDDRRLGWPTLLTTGIFEPDEDELTGGKIIVWSPDDKQGFPTGFGADKKIFTPDDPVAPLPAGYSVIDLDAAPFKVIRSAEVELTLLEPPNYAVKDYSKQSYSEAFANMTGVLRKGYAFNDVPGRAPDWAKIDRDIAPLVKQAEDKKDPYAFYAAIRKFTAEFVDGHVGTSASKLVGRAIVDEFGGGFGLVLRELDDGRVIIKTAAADMPAAKAGLRAGQYVTAIDGVPVKKALDETVPFGQSFSTPWAKRAEQLSYISRARRGGSKTFTVQGVGDVKLASAPEFDSLFDLQQDFEPASPVALPIEWRLLDSGIGYIRINSNSDDAELSYRLMQRAYENFEKNKIDRIIVDLRQNGGGAPFGLAGRFLLNGPVPNNERGYYFNEKAGVFETSRTPPLPYRPHERTFAFKKMATLVGRECASACEFEAWMLAQVPGMIIVGHTPTAGMYGEVSRGQFVLPEEIRLQASMGRSQTTDGKLFIEGTGVAPTLRVPVTEESVLGKGDAVLKAAEAALR